MCPWLYFLDCWVVAAAAAVVVAVGSVAGVGQEYCRPYCLLGYGDSRLGMVGVECRL